MNTNETSSADANRLVALSDLKDYKVAKDSPDVSGWRLIGANGESLGMVKDLIVDLQAMKTRYLSVLADRKFFNASDDQYLLVPIGAAALDKKNRRVFVSHLDATSIAQYPVYPGGPIREDYEYAIRDHFQQNSHPFVGNTPAAPSSVATPNNVTDTPPPTMATPTNRVSEQETPANRRVISPDFYDNQHYNENQFYTSNQEIPQRDSTILYNSSLDPDREVKVSPPVNTSADNTAAATTNVSQNTGNSKSVEESIATIERLEQLRERGSITEEEFRVLKRKAINL